MRTRFTAAFLDWLDSVGDVVTRARIQFRIDRLALDHKDGAVAADASEKPDRGPENRWPRTAEQDHLPKRLLRVFFAFVLVDSGFSSGGWLAA